MIPMILRRITINSTSKPNRSKKKNLAIQEWRAEDNLKNLILMSSPLLPSLPPTLPKSQKMKKESSLSRKSNKAEGAVGVVINDYPYHDLSKYILLFNITKRKTLQLHITNFSYLQFPVICKVLEGFQSVHVPFSQYSIAGFRMVSYLFIQMPTLTDWV